MADVRRAVRAALIDRALPGGRTPDSGSKLLGRREGGGGLVLVALSGGPDSLALAAATAFEAPRAGLRAGAVVVDHGLQPGSAEVAARAAQQARDLGLDPVLVRRVEVHPRPAATAVPERPAPTPVPERAQRDAGRPTSVPERPAPTPVPERAQRDEGPPPAYPGPEAAAREARYAALESARADTAASAVLLGHTLDDQAETVLLGLARGAGAASLQGMAAVGGPGDAYLRPLLGLRRTTTLAACADQGLEPWTDPQNADTAFSRVRVRERVLPVLEAELGPGIAEALARTAEQLREDQAALEAMTQELVEDLVLEGADPVTEEPFPGGGISLPVAGLAANPPAIRHRLIRLVVQAEFGRSLTRAQTLDVARLVTDWRGQGPLDLPGVTAARRGASIVFTARDPE